MARIDSFLKVVTEQNASDLHFCAGSPPIIRHDGDLLPLPFRMLTDNEARRFLLEILIPEQRARFESTYELDFVYEMPGVGRFRANYYMQSRGMGGVFRVIPGRMPTLEGLDLPDSIRRLTQYANGLVLVTGPTGSGKSTTLAALVNEINRTMSKHIISVEDPVEFIHPPQKSVVTQRQIGRDVESFSSALRSALREAPDVLVVGEMRDLETIQLALTAAETGTLVFGTLHTNSAPSAVDRIIDATPEESRDQVRGVLSVLLRGVMAQHLVKRATGEGRVAAYELLVQNYATNHLIREGKVHMLDGILASSENSATGMIGLDSCLFNYLKQGIVSLQEALRVAKDPDHLKSLAADLPEEL